MADAETELREKIKAFRKRREERDAERLRMAKVRREAPKPKAAPGRTWADSIGKTPFSPSPDPDKKIRELLSQIKELEQRIIRADSVLTRERGRRVRAEEALEELKAQISEETGQAIVDTWVSGITDEEGNPISPPSPPKENPYENNDKFGAF